MRQHYKTGIESHCSGKNSRLLYHKFMINGILNNLIVIVGLGIYNHTLIRNVEVPDFQCVTALEPRCLVDPRSNEVIPITQNAVAPVAAIGI